MKRDQFNNRDLSRVIRKVLLENEMEGKKNKKEKLSPVTADDSLFGIVEVKPKKRVKKISTVKVVKAAPRLPKSSPSKTTSHEFSDISNGRRLESLAMIQHVHGGGRHKKKNIPGLRLLRMSDVLDDNWSLWHLSWAVLWRLVVIFVVVRFLAALSVVYFGNIILSK